MNYIKLTNPPPITEPLLVFIRNHTDLIERGDVEGLINAWYNDPIIAEIDEDGEMELSDITTLLYAAGIDPLANLDYIPEGFFAFAENLEAITIPGHIKKIGENAFSGCSNLLRISLSEGVEIIEGVAINNCAELKLVELPASLKYIGTAAFSWGTKIQRVNYSGTKAQWEQIRIAEDNDGLTKHGIHCKDGIIPGYIHTVHGGRTNL